MRRVALALIASVSILAIAATAFAATHAKTLVGTVGPGFTISMGPKTVKAGAYTITIHDKSNIHDFHLAGPGVNKKTTVSGVGTSTWKVTLKKGTYTFVCDPHKTIMHGVLKVT